jgi:hypothetical protein
VNRRGFFGRLFGAGAAIGAAAVAKKFDIVAPAVEAEAPAAGPAVESVPVPMTDYFKRYEQPVTVGYWNSTVGDWTSCLPHSTQTGTEPQMTSGTYYAWTPVSTIVYAPVELVVSSRV